MTETVLILLSVTVLIWGIVTFNRLVKRKNHVLEAWSGIEVQLKRRHSLIPNLVEAVKAYSQYEQNVLTLVTELRSQQHSKASVSERAAAESALSRSIRQLIAVAEAYPELKASDSFINLQQNLTGVEEQIQYARRYFNATVRELNILVQSFPSRLIASLFKYTEADYFEIELAIERVSPEVKF
jgi:LemA protein